MEFLTTPGSARVILLGVYIGLSVVTFAVYARDKSAAIHGRRRTPEITLHLLAVAGGWPGALAGQRAFRHKTIKQPFQAVFWGTVIANCLMLAWLLGRLSDAAI